MARSGVILGVLIALVSLAAPRYASGQVAARPKTESIALGQTLATRNCAMCHSVGKSGASPNKHAPPFRDLHQRMEVEMLGEGLAQGILTNHPAMPEFRFAPHEVIAIIRYLKFAQARQRAQQ
eukprot:gene5187-biopygen4608